MLEFQTNGHDRALEINPNFLRAELYKYIDHMRSDNSEKSAYGQKMLKDLYARWKLVYNEETDDDLDIYAYASLAY